MSRQETVRFTNRRGESLAGVLHHPEASGGSDAVVVAHGMLSSKDSPKHREICERAASRGRLALRFDFAGRGSSEGDPELLTVSREVEDLHTAVDFVRELGRQFIHLVGSSLGGTVAILAAARRSDVTGLVTIASPARVPTTPKRAWGGNLRASRSGRVEVAPATYISAEFFSDAVHHEVISAAQQVTVPWLILHGERDEVVPVENSRELAAARDGACLITHPTADHRFSQKAAQEWLMEQVDGFLRNERPLDPRCQPWPSAATTLED